MGLALRVHLLPRWSRFQRIFSWFSACGMRLTAWLCHTHFAWCLASTLVCRFSFKLNTKRENFYFLRWSCQRFLIFFASFYPHLPLSWTHLPPEHEGENAPVTVFFDTTVIYVTQSSCPKSSYWWHSQNEAKRIRWRWGGVPMSPENFKGLAKALAQPHSECGLGTPHYSISYGDICIEICHVWLPRARKVRAQAAQWSPVSWGRWTGVYELEYFRVSLFFILVARVDIYASATTCYS